MSTPDERRAIEQTNNEWRVVRLSEELDKFIKMVAHCREALDNELMSGLGYKKLAIGDKDLRKVKDLGATFNSAVEAKIRFDKAQKSLQAAMTPQEEREAVITYLKSLPYEDRNAIFKRATRKKPGQYGYEAPEVPELDQNEAEDEIPSTEA